MWVDLFLGFAWSIYECFRLIQNVFLQFCVVAVGRGLGVTMFRVRFARSDHCLGFPWGLG